MGYDTDYKGALLFSNEDTLTAKELRYLTSILREDVREHKEWRIFINKDSYLTYIDFELMDDFSGIRHNGAEKSHSQVDAINLIKALMEHEFKKPFILKGKILCQGEDIEDRWLLSMNEDGIASRIDISLESVITCPSCGHRFELKE